MKFIKMHGLGNDYVYVETFTQKLGDVNELARRVSDRHFGVGSDGLILVMPSEVADVKMRMFNVDGSEGEMCGNGVRCVAKFAYDNRLATANPMRVETGRGILTIDLDVVGGKVRAATVDMGAPILEQARIPVDPRHFSTGEREAEHKLELAGVGTPVVFVSMGNPHVVSFTTDLQSVDLNRVGPLMEMHPAFPRRVNAHWAQVFSPTEIAMKTWERGSGITLACGTGACSVLVAGVLTGRTARKATIHLPGGDLLVEWREESVFMTGPATEVFRGEWMGV